MSKAYPQIVQDALNNIDAKRKLIVDLVAAAAAAERIIKDFEHLEPSVSLNSWSTPQVVVYLRPKTMSQLAEILRRFSKRGFRLKNVTNHEFCQEMNYDLQGGIKVEAKFAKQDGEEEAPAQCRYVKVGEKTRVVTEPIYELQCD